MRTHLPGTLSFALCLGCCLAFPLPHCGGADGTPAPPPRPATPPAPSSRPSTGLPAVPDAATQQKAMRVVEEVYRPNLSEAKTPSRQAALAETLLQTARATRNDPAGQYALLTKAQDLAAAAGRFTLALDAAAEIARRWDVDALKLRTDALTNSAKVPRNVTQAAEFSRAADAVVKDAVAAGRFDLARRSADVASAVVRVNPATDAAAVKEAAARATDVADLQQAYARAEPTLARLRSPAVDAATRLAAGKYLCFARGDWAAGLPQLAAGNDPAVSSLAKNELNPAQAGGAQTAAQARMAVADGWWAYAETQAGLTRRQIRLHAAACYNRALPDLVGLAKSKAELRVKEAESQDGAAALASWAVEGGGIKFVNQIAAKEGQEVLDQVVARDPALLKGVEQAELVKVHDGSEFHRNAGGPRDLAGAYSAHPVAGKNSGITFWGVYEPWAAGKYLVVYRIQALEPITGGDVCFCDVCTGGRTIAKRHPKAADLEQPGWHEIGFPMELSEKTTVEFRLWVNNHEIAIDRVYLFRLGE